jgi:hypothetical protein
MGLFSGKPKAPPVQVEVVRAHVAEQTEIVGLAHHAAALDRAMTREERRASEVAVDVVLIPEPTNAVDPNAIGAYWRGQLIGYVPKRETSPFHRQIGDLTPGTQLGVYGVIVLREGKRYLRVYTHIRLMPAQVGPPGPLLTIGGMQVQELDQAAITHWTERSGNTGADVVHDAIAQLALHPLGPKDVLVILDGETVGAISKAKRDEVARQVKAAERKGQTLGTQVRLTRTEAGWRIWIEQTAHP